MLETETCPCGTGKSFADCCGKYVIDSDLPPTAESLMRSRYTAYTLGDEPYLLKTWHPSTHPGAGKLDLDPSTKWIGLSVLSTNDGRENDSEGTVEFKARYKIGGKAYRMHETSRFVKEGGQWFYVDGEMKDTN